MNEELAEELHKPVIKKFQKRRVYSRFRDNIWAADLPGIRSLSGKSRNFQYFLFVIDVFAKNSWVKALKDKKIKTVGSAFIEIVNEFDRKPNNLWIDQGKEFQNKPKRKWLDDNDILVYSTRNEGKSGIVERFIKTLKGKIYKT